MLHHSQKSEISWGKIQRLDQVQRNRRVKILDIDGEWGIRQHITQLGIHLGDEMTVVQCCNFGGPILVIVNDSRVALGRGMARKIIVREL